MRSIEDIQEWLQNNDISDAEQHQIRQWLISLQDESYGGIEWIVTYSTTGKTFQEFRDFVNSEPEKMEVYEEKSEKWYLEEILDEMRGIHETLKILVKPEATMKKPVFSKKY